MNASTQPEAAGPAWFFTMSLENRGVRWLVEHVADLRQAFRDVRARHAFDIEAIVVLPEHLHALWRLPVDDADYATRWMLIKDGFTERLRAAGVVDAEEAQRGRSRKHPVWQRRCWEHRIADEDDFRRHVDYIHFNPVKHGWVRRAADWPFSSLHRHIRDGRLPADWGIDAPIEGTFGE